MEEFCSFEKSWINQTVITFQISLWRVVEVGAQEEHPANPAPISSPTTSSSSPSQVTPKQCPASNSHPTANGSPAAVQINY